MTLNNEEDAIKQAVDAGYGNPSNSKVMKVEFDNELFTIVFWDNEGNQTDRCTFRVTDTLQDPAFWIALGKARGWEFQHFNKNGLVAVNHKGKSRGKTRCNAYCLSPDLYHAVRYFETRLSGGDTETYWKNLP